MELLGLEALGGIVGWAVGTVAPHRPPKRTTETRRYLSDLALAESMHGRVDPAARTTREHLRRRYPPTLPIWKFLDWPERNLPRATGFLA